MFSRMKRNAIAIFALVVAMGLAGFMFQSSVSGGGQFISIRGCGTTAACAIALPSNVKFAYGSAPLVSGTPSTLTLTGLPFTSSSSYTCTANDVTTGSNGIASIANASGASTVITGGATLTDTINYVCAGT